MEDIIDVDYTHAERVCKDFDKKNQDNIMICMFKVILYCQLMQVFENFRNMCLEIYKLDSSKFISAPGLTWQTALKKTKVKLDLLTDIDMLLMVEIVIKGGICPSIYRYAKANNKYMKYYDKDKESL